MVGDYISSSFAGGKALAIFAVGKAPSGGAAFDEGMYTAGGLAILGGTVASEVDNRGTAGSTAARRFGLTW